MDLREQPFQQKTGWFSRISNYIGYFYHLSLIFFFFLLFFFILCFILSFNPICFRFIFSSFSFRVIFFSVFRFFYFFLLCFWFMVVTILLGFRRNHLIFETFCTDTAFPIFSLAT